ncbi:ogr/Delta-like zinc finger family protein [Halomonas sp. MC140]|nr:ogr/Delta-like zinc finger family protein [Halomonas sp. MC140]MDN7131751.1 ogr/Delta-like zinc finger family protein [Halomonas sp. MC140]
MSIAYKHRIPCPHCGQNLRIRKSQGLTPVYREAVVECRNDDCGFRGKAGIEVTNTLTPSDTPNPMIDLPFVPRMQRAMEAKAAS